MISVACHCVDCVAHEVVAVTPQQPPQQRGQSVPMTTINTQVARRRESATTGGC